MGLFGSFKKKPEKKTWMVYQDMLGTKKMSVRVDTQYIDKDYKNTFYIKASYCDSTTDDLPDRAFLESLADLEEKALEETMKVLKRLRQSVTQEELTRAKEQLKAGLVMGMEGISSRAGSAARSCLLENRIYTEDMLIQRVDAVTLDELMQKAQQSLCFDRMAVAAAGRLKSQAFYQSLRA